MDNARTKPSDRRGFLKALGVAGAAAGTLPLSSASAGAAADMKMPTPTTGTEAQPPAGYIFFNFFEALFVEAAVDTLIPADATGPGALELGVATYIDRQLAGSYGKGARLYLQGPFADGTPQQGYQLALTPAELIRAGIADIDAYAQKKHETTFAALKPPERTSLLSEIDAGKVELATVPADVFFDRLLTLTMEGYFGDPIYGGNKNKAAWKMIGFPGVGGMYADKIEEFRNKTYAVEPKSIQDLS